MHWEPLIVGCLLYLALGIGAGLLSGLLGAGGGLIMVPGLLPLLRWESVNPAILMHVAVGTSLASMIPIAVRSLTSHLKLGAPFFFVYKKMAAGVVIGVLIGGISAHFIHSDVLRIAFGLFVLVMAYTLLFPKKRLVPKQLPGITGMSAAGGFVGVLSGLIGIGGSAFIVPFLSNHSVNMRSAVSASIAFAATCAVIGTMTYIFTGMHASGLPHWTTGYVLWPAWFGLSIGGVFMAPIGAKISHHISEHHLKIYFAIFLVVISIHMLWI